MLVAIRGCQTIGINISDIDDKIAIFVTKTKVATKIYSSENTSPTSLNILTGSKNEVLFREIISLMDAIVVATME